MKTKRIRVLLEIDELNKERCEACIESDAKAVNCECTAAEKIRMLGEELLNFTKPRFEREIKLLSEIKFKDMTGDYYWMFKASEISDVVIRDKLGVSEAMFYKWKKENRAIVKRGASV